MPKNTAQRSIDSPYASAIGGASASSGGGGVTTVTDHGSLTGLSDDDHSQYLTSGRGDARYVALATQVIAGTGLAGGGALSANVTLSLPSTVAGGGLGYSSGVVAVGAGLGITVNADDVALASSVAGDGLAYSSGVLSVGIANTGAAGLSVEANVVRLTSSAAGAADAHILATDASGYTAVVKLRTPTIDTASGALSLAPNSGLVSLPSAVAIGTNNYASQLTGWRATYAGEGDFRYLFVDEMHAKSFIADLEQALAGGQIISKSVAVLYLPFTAPTPGSTLDMYVEDLPSAPDMAVFEEGDTVLVRQFSRAGGSLTIYNCWGVVSGYVDGTVGNGIPGAQFWHFTRSTAPNTGGMNEGTVIPAKALVLDFGVSGNGYYEVNAIDGLRGINSPYARIVKWTTHPASGSAVVGQYGNLRGAYGYSGAEYGLAVGEYAAGKANITIDPTNGVRIRSHSTDILAIKNSDGKGYIVGPMYLDTAGGIYQGSGTFASPTTGLKLWNDSGVGRIGGFNATTLQWHANTDGRLNAGAGAVVLDVDGVKIRGGTSVWEQGTSLEWYGTPTTKTTLYGRLGIHRFNTGEDTTRLTMEVKQVGADRADVIIRTLDIAGATVASLWLTGSGLQINGTPAVLTSGASFTGTVQIDKATGNALRVNTGDFSMGGSYTFGIDAVGTGNGRFVVATNGNVGIGVASPSFKLQVAGSIAIPIDSYLSSSNTSTANTIELYDNTNGRMWFNTHYGGSNGGYRFQVSGADKVTFDGDGAVLIGTTSNTYNAKLVANGDVFSYGAVTATSFIQMIWRTSVPAAVEGYGRLWVKNMDNNNKMQLRFRTYLGDYLVVGDP